MTRKARVWKVVYSKNDKKDGIINKYTEAL